MVVGGRAFGAKEDTVYFREPGKKQDSKLVGKIEEESPAGIKLKPTKGEAKNVPALQITQIEYGAATDASGGNVAAVDFRRPDSKLLIALAESRAEKRADGFRTALLGFQTLAANENLRRLAPVRRYLQFRVAQTQYYLAREDASRRDAAITALKDYKSNFGDGWEIVPALQALSSLQEDKGDTEAASQTFSDLAAVPGISSNDEIAKPAQGRALDDVHQ